MRIFIFLIAAAFAHALTPTSYINHADKDRIISVLNNAASPKFNDVGTAQYVLKSYKLLSIKSSNAAADCKFLKENLDAKNVESIYHVTEGSKALDSCKIPVPDAQNTLNKALDGASSQVLLQVVSSLKNLGFKIDSKKISTALAAAVKKDDGLSSLGYAFHVASELSGDIGAFYDRIEDVIVQADEVDGKFLQFEGGIGVTAMIVSGIYRLSETAKKTPPISNEQVVKFTNYILSRKTTPAIRGLYYLLESLTLFTKNKFHIPISITLASNVALSKENPEVKVRITNVLGEALPNKLTVTADTVTQVKDAAVILSKEAFSEVKGDSSLFTLNMLKKDKNLMSTYKIAVSAIPKKADSRFIGNMGAPISINFLVDVDIRDVEIGTAEIDQSSSPKLNKVTYPSKINSQISADTHQRLILKFNLKNRNNNAAFSAHQVFFQLTNIKTKQEITFVHEHNDKGSYKFDVDLKTKASDFNKLSGVYSASILVGDKFSSNSYDWKIAEVALNFPESGSTSKHDMYTKKPEIKHIFREPEPRPSEFVSNLFTGLIFVPLVILFILWLKIGANMSNFTFSLSAIGFHTALAGVFGLFFVFWLKLDMFVTVKYLVGLGIAIFLCGNNLLSSLAKKKN